jgi:nucleoside-diphosphate-sugar epimerase
VRIAVTGGSGFIGRATLREAERRGYSAWSFDRPSDIMGDLTTLTGADVVIHLAGVLGTAELFDDPHYAVDVNVHGALRVLEWCHDNGAGYVGITMPPVFPSVYTATKICADRLASAWHEAFGVPVSRVRAFNAYGQGQKHGPGHPQKIIPTFATLAWEGKPLPVWGDGMQTVDLVHADDVGRMLIGACRFGDDEIFDAGTGVSLTVRDIAEFTIECVGAGGGPRSEIEYLPMRVGERPTNIAANGDGWDKITWRPEFSWDRLAQVIHSYRPEQK